MDVLFKRSAKNVLSDYYPVSIIGGGIIGKTLAVALGTLKGLSFNSQIY
jgi:hypothetical protein